MGAGGLPGEADGWTIFKMVGYWDRIEGPETEEPTRVVSLADPASALRALLADERALEGLAQWLAYRDHHAGCTTAKQRWGLLVDSARQTYLVTARRAVDALASGVEGDDGTAGDGR